MSKKLGRRAPHGAWWRIGLLAAVLANPDFNTRENLLSLVHDMTR